MNKEQTLAGPFVTTNLSVNTDSTNVELIDTEEDMPINEDIKSPDYNPKVTEALQILLNEAAKITNIIKTAKTKTKIDFNKKKLKSLQKKLQILLYTQYLKGKEIPQESSEIS